MDEPDGSELGRFPQTAGVEGLGINERGKTADCDDYDCSQEREKAGYKRVQANSCGLATKVTLLEGLIPEKRVGLSWECFPQRIAGRLWVVP